MIPSSFSIGIRDKTFRMFAVNYFFSSRATHCKPRSRKSGRVDRTP
jgi:hypothetical protein